MGVAEFGMHGWGYSPLTVTRRYIYTIGRKNKNNQAVDVITCLDRRRGTIRWQYNYCPEETFPDPGPVSRPVVDKRRLFYFSRDGVLLCLNRRTGRLLWYQDLPQEGALGGENGFTGSPVIYRDSVILNAYRSGVAFNRGNGTILWRSEEGITGDSSPVPLICGEETFFVIQGQHQLFIIKAADGSVVSSVPMSSQFQIPVISPMILDDGRILVNTLNDQSRILQFSGNRLTPADTGSFIPGPVTSLVKIDRLLFLYQGYPEKRRECRLLCYKENESGILWSGNMGCFGSFLLLDDSLILLNENGYLQKLHVDEKGFQSIVTEQVFREHWSAWLPPVVYDDRLYLKSNTGEIMGIDIQSF